MIAPQPPTEWMRSASGALGQQVHVARPAGASARRRADTRRGAAPARSGASAAACPSARSRCRGRSAGAAPRPRSMFSTAAIEVAGLEVAAAEAEAPGVEVGHVGRGERRRARGGARPRPCRPARGRSRPPATSRRGSRAAGARPPRAAGRRARGPRRPSCPASRRATRSAGNGRNIVRLSTPTLQLARRAQVVGHRLGVATPPSPGPRSPSPRPRAGSPTRARSARPVSARELLEGPVGRARRRGRSRTAAGRRRPGRRSPGSGPRRASPGSRGRTSRGCGGACRRRRAAGPAVGDSIRSAGSPRYSLTSARLGEAQRLDHVAGEEPVLGADAGVERQLGDAVRDEVEVGRVLHVLREELEEAGVVDRVVVVVAGSARSAPAWSWRGTPRSARR